MAATYNRYRKRTYNISKTMQREYAAEMQSMWDWFLASDWTLSIRQDSAYKDFDRYTVRLSNHSADNQYHDLHSGRLLINIKASKLEFQNIIETKIENILEKVNELELDKYRFINIVNGKMNCFIKGFKTKKEVFEL